MDTAARHQAQAYTIIEQLATTLMVLAMMIRSKIWQPEEWLALGRTIGAMAELESSLISERVKAGMEAARARGKQVGRPATPAHVVARIEERAHTTSMSIRRIHSALDGQVSRSFVGEIVKRVRYPS